MISKEGRHLDICPKEIGTKKNHHDNPQDHFKTWHIEKGFIPLGPVPVNSYALGSLAEDQSIQVRSVNGLNAISHRKPSGSAK